MDQFGIDDSQVGMPPATGAFGPPGGTGPLWWIRQVRQAVQKDLGLPLTA